MRSEDLDRILSDEAPLEPSPGFAVAVMVRVRADAPPPPSPPFPWLRLLLGNAALGAGGWIVLSRPVPRGLRGALDVASTAFDRALVALGEPHTALVLGGTVAALAGTYLLVHWTLRSAGAHR
jgi:hypothetical protein